MCTILSFCLNKIKDTRNTYCSIPMEFSINNQYLIIVRSRKVFIITNHEGVQNIKTNYNKCQFNNKDYTKCILRRGILYQGEQDIAYVNQYNSKSPRHSYLISNAGTTHINQFSNLKVLCLEYYCNRRDNQLTNVPLYIICQDLTRLIRDKEILHWYIVLKSVLINDVVFYIFSFILNQIS